MRELETFGCDYAGLALEGLVARPDGDGPFPTVIVMHSALGIRHQVRAAAEKLAALGYLAVVTDMYGPAVQNGGPDAPGASYVAMSEIPGMVRERAVAWFDAVAAHADVDSSRIAAIGYCFGGTCVLEMARSGADVKAVVSYHGILTTHARAEAGAIKGEVHAYCGAIDPFAPMATIDALRGELTEAGVRYNIAVFGEVAHGFTDTGASSLGVEGIAYDEVADRVSWAGTLALLEKVLQG